MPDSAFRYQFNESMDMDEVEAAFVLAIFATESIHGESDTRLHAEHTLDLKKRTCAVDGNTSVGRDLNRLFTGFLRREFGENSFTVQKTDIPVSRTASDALEVESAQ